MGACDNPDKPADEKQIGRGGSRSHAPLLRLSSCYLAHRVCGLNLADGAAAVKAKQLIDGASYGPDALKAIGRLSMKRGSKSPANSEMIAQGSKKRAANLLARFCRLPTKTAEMSGF